MSSLEDFIKSALVQEESQRRVRLGCTGVDLDIDAEKLYSQIERSEMIKAYWRGKREFWSRQVQKSIQKGMCSREATILFRECTERKHGDWIWCTINPRPGVTLMQLFDAINKWTRKKHVICALWNFEQRGRTEDDLGSGIHTHMLMRQTYAYASNLKQDLRTCFSPLCESHLDACLHWRTCLHEHLKHRVSYVKGLKKPKSKQTLVDFDRQWRKRQSIQDSYQTTNFDTVIASYLTQPQSDLSDEED